MMLPAVALACAPRELWWPRRRVLGVPAVAGQGRGAAPQNLAFAGPDKKTLFVVGRGVASKVQMIAQGFKDRAK